MLAPAAAKSASPKSLPSPAPFSTDTEKPALISFSTAFGLDAAPVAAPVGAPVAAPVKGSKGEWGDKGEWGNKPVGKPVGAPDAAPVVAANASAYVAANSSAIAAAVTASDAAADASTGTSSASVQRFPAARVITSHEDLHVAAVAPLVNALLSHRLGADDAAIFALGDSTATEAALITSSVRSLLKGLAASRHELVASAVAIHAVGGSSGASASQQPREAVTDLLQPVPSSSRSASDGVSALEVRLSLLW